MSDDLVIAHGDFEETIPWAPPGAGETAGQLETEHGAVRVAAPRGFMPGTHRYPGPVDGPRVRDHKRRLPSDRLAYFPRMHLEAHPTEWAFPAYLDNPGCRWLQTLKGLYELPISFPASLSPEAGLLVHSIVRNIRPRLVLETGTFVGISTLWISGALRENGDGGTVHTFDDMSPIRKGPWRDVEITHNRIGWVASHFAASGLADHIVMHPGNSSIELRAMQKDLIDEGGVQLAFLDADHTEVGVCQDLWATEPMLNTGGFLLFHDTFPEYCSHDGPRVVIDRINQIATGVYESVDLYLAPNNYGLAVLRRIG